MTGDETQGSLYQPVKRRIEPRQKNKASSCQKSAPELDSSWLGTGSEEVARG